MDWRARKILDNVWGPSGSIIIHAIILIVLINLVSFKRPSEQRTVEVIMQEVEAFDDLEELQETLEELEDIPTVVDAVAPPNVSVDEEPPAVDAVAGPAADVDLAGFEALDSVTPLRLKGFFKSRSSSGRADALGKYAGGMGGRTEFAVLRALNWLRDHQYEDGSWGPEYRVAMTSIALMAFFAHGETTGSPDYGMAIRKGLQFLLKRQDKGVFRGGGWSHPHHHAAHPSQIMAYEHAIGTYAISEAYAMTSIPFLKYAMEDAIQIIIDGQHGGGSWDYGYNTSPEAHFDVSLSGWHLQALKAALSAGAENRGLKTAIDSGMRGLTYLADKEMAHGQFKYSTREAERFGDIPMTGVAVLCMQLCGHWDDADALAGMRALEKLNFQWRKGDEANQDTRLVRDWPIYSWYYITQARFHKGGASWVTWNRKFAPGLCAMQNPNGTWCPPPSSTEGVFGPVYHTALSCLMLEVYYRFLPTFKPIEVEAADTIEDTLEEDDEIIIKFG